MGLDLEGVGWTVELKMNSKNRQKMDSNGGRCNFVYIA